MFTKKLVWVLVIGLLNLVSVDAKERSQNPIFNSEAPTGGIDGHHCKGHHLGCMVSRSSTHKRPKKVKKHFVKRLGKRGVLKFY